MFDPHKKLPVKKIPSHPLLRLLAPLLLLPFLPVLVICFFAMPALLLVFGPLLLLMAAMDFTTPGDKTDTKL